MPTVTYDWDNSVSSTYVNTFMDGNQALPAIARTSGGNSYYTAWFDSFGAVEGRGISNDLDFLTGETVVNQTTTGVQTDPSIVQLISTSIFNLTPPNIVVTYTDYSVDAGGDIRARFLSGGPGILGGSAYGTPGAEIEISTTASDDFDSDVAALADGGFVVSYTRDFGGGDLDTRATILNANGTVRVATVVGDSSVSLSTSRTQVVGLTNGNFVMVWEQEPAAGGDTEVVYRIFDENGVAQTSATIIDTFGTVNEDIQIVALADGGFAVAYVDNGWFLSGGSGLDITLAIFNADGSDRSDYVFVNAGAVTGDQVKPTLTTLSNGYIVVGWNDPSGNTNYQAYTPQGVAIGSAYSAFGSSVESEITGLTGGLLANVRQSSFADDDGQSIRTSIDELTRTTLGDATNEVLAGDSLRDTIDGGAGDDVISGGSNTDSLTGGAGFDTFRDTSANLNGDTIADFRLGDRIHITNANPDTFTFSLAGNTLTYSGGSLTLTTVPVDRIVARAAEGGGVELVVHDADNAFNDDGRSDVLWRNVNSGQFQQWQAQLNGGFAGNPNASGSVPTNWFIAGSGDYNGDGRDDILWRSSAGDFQEWLGQPNGGYVGNPNATGTAPTNWSIAGSGDFNGDGRDDILWRSTTGDFQEWLGQPNGGFVGNPNAMGFVPTEYRVTAVGDFNGDGRDDILWRHNDGSFVEWLAQPNGGFANNPFASGSAPGNWQVVGAGDFNGDGRDDILWRSTAGDFQEWLGQANGGFVGNPNASGTVSTSWQIDAIGDYNGDGRDDILWRSSAGDFQVWSAQANGGFVGNPNATGVASTDWVVQSPNIYF